MRPFILLSVALRLLSALVIAFGVPYLFFGLLGVTGRLSDTSERENLQQGLVFFGLAVAALTFGTLGLMLSTQLGEPGKGGPKGG